MGKRGPKPKPKSGVTRETPKDTPAIIRAGRVTHIVGLMRALRWETGVTGPSLAREWGCSVSAVENYSDLASKIVIAELGPEHLKARVLVGFEGLAARADASGDFKTAGHMLSELARLGGVDAPIQVDVRATQVTIAEIVSNPDYVLPEKSE